jgi:predicted RNA binding protein YcfA (HicA-like mRNA interferase family)
MMADCWSSTRQDGSHEQVVSSEGRRKSSGMKTFLSQGNRFVARKTLGNIWPFAARFMHFLIVRHFDRR